MTDSDDGQALTIRSPLRGWCDALDDNPDDVFRGRVLGDGVSIDPFDGRVVAPCDGVVVNLPDSRHAITLRADNGAELMIHVGVDTVGLRGNGFVAHVGSGERVRCGQRLLSFDLDTVVRGATSLRSPVVLLSKDAFELRVTAATGAVDAGDEICRVIAIAAGHAGTDADGGAVTTPDDQARRVEASVVVGLPHGVHARPAARIADCARALDADIKLTNPGGDEAAAVSPVALMTLGIAALDEITVTASGADADAAVREIVSLLQPVEGRLAASRRDDDGALPTKDPAPAAGSVLPGQPAAAGLACGTSLRVRDWQPPDDVPVGTVTSELGALNDALDVVRLFLDKLAASSDGTAAEIAAVHRALLDDETLLDDARTRIERGDGASNAWRFATETIVGKLHALKDRRMRERGDDLVDVGRRVQRALAGLDPADETALADDTIVLADTLLPSQLLEWDRSKVAGICTAAGGATSHAAILAATLGIPMVIGVGEPILAIADGTTLLLDAETGKLTVAPTASETGRFERRRATAARRQADAEAHARDRCFSADEVRILVKANLLSADDAAAAVTAGADGCGLLRSEFIFMERDSAPTERQQLDVYQRIADALGDRRLTVRTLDAGSDKPIHYLEQGFEDNPALGLRGIRLSLSNRELLKTQLSALCRTKTSGPLRVMLPMVTAVHEVDAVCDLLRELGAAEPGRAGPELGVMIETPAAALISDRLAERVSFFSIGSNDLAQYALAMDRTAAPLAGRPDVLHPAVLKLIAMTVAAGERRELPVSVCGSAAGESLAIPLLLGLGVRELSMAPVLIAQRKADIRRYRIADCESLARDALSQRSAEDVRALAEAFVRERDRDL